MLTLLFTERSWKGLEEVAQEIKAFGVFLF